MSETSDHRQEAIDLMEAAWERGRDSGGTDTAIPIQCALSQTAALLYVGDQLAKLASAVGSEQAAMGKRTPAFLRVRRP